MPRHRAGLTAGGAGAGARAAPSLRRALLVLAGPTVLSACGGFGADVAARDAEPGVFRMALPEVAAIDPALAADAESQTVTRALYQGLLTLDEANLRPAPGVAERWESTADCSRWTFHLAETTFSTGEPVTARSFVDGATRAAAEPTSGVAAVHLGGVAGFEALRAEAVARPPGKRPGGSPPALAGVSAPDARTFVVDLARPDCEFHWKAIQPVMSPVPRSTPPAGDRSFGDQPVGNGPFRLQGPWRHDRSIRLVPNERYHGERPRLSGVHFRIVPFFDAPASEYRAFQAGLVDWARIPTQLAPHARALFGPTGKFLDAETTSVTYLAVRTDRPPFDNAAARKALSAAIDREAIARGVFKGFRPPATSLVPPAIAAAYSPGVCDACTHDPDKARRWAAAGGLRVGTRVEFPYAAGFADAWSQAMARQIEDVLGLDVDLLPLEGPQVQERAAAPGFAGMALFGWFADYPTAENFLGPLLGAGAPDNHSAYTNPAVDRLLAEARAATGAGPRLARLREAERVAIGEDLALIPLWYRTEQRVIGSDRFSGIRLDFFLQPALIEIVPR